MLEYLIVSVPAFFTASLLGFIAITDPIEATIDHVGVPAAFEEAGYTPEYARLVLHSEIEAIGQITGSWIGDKRVRVAEMESGVEALGNALFGLDEVVESSLRALDIVDYIVEVHYVETPGRFIVKVQFRDAWSGSFITQRRFEVAAEGEGEAGFTREVFHELTRNAARYIVRTAEPYLFAAYLYTEASEKGADLVPVLRFIDAHLDDVRTREVPWMHNLRGLVAADLGVYAYALREYERAIALAPGFPAPYYNWGRLLHDLGEPEKAAALIRKGLRRDQHAVGHLYLAEALIALGDSEGALAELRRAKRLAPDFERVNAMLAEVLARRGDLAAAAAAERAAARARAVDQNQARFVPF